MTTKWKCHACAVTDPHDLGWRKQGIPVINLDRIPSPQLEIIDVLCPRCRAPLNYHESKLESAPR